MGFFKKLFGNRNEETPNHTNFRAGDLFYTKSENGQYNLCKLLLIDEATDTFHIKGYDPLSNLPDVIDTATLKVQIHHFPIASSGFKNPKFIRNEEVNDYDLIGYLAYIKHTQNTNEIVKYAQSFYKQAHELSSKGKHEEAIDKYAKAIELIPAFFEAIDNRAFCFMDLGQWQEAIKGFKQSLQVNPNSLLANFSIGECYLRLKNYTKAKEYFKIAAQIDPNHPKPKEFLAMTQKLMEG